MHEEPTHFKSDDAPDVIKAGAAHKSDASQMSVKGLTSGGWMRSGADSSSSWFSSSSSHPLIGEPAGSMSHMHKAMLLFIGGAVVWFVRKWLRSQGATRRPAGRETSGTVKLGGSDDAFARKGGLNFSPKDETFKKMNMT
tara:strand:- start:570 stop:989 length:420 start_codon:yes stop_codon:yes gene_type:complete